MKNISTLLMTVMILTVWSIISGCSGGGGKSRPESKTGVFMDSPVAGIRYSTSSGQTGMTNASGEFNYLEGDTVDFYIGYCPIASMPTDDILTVFDALEPEKVAMLLQALDEDDNPENGISIPEALSEKFNASLFSITEVNPDDADFKKKFKEITGKDFWVNQESALGHAEGQLRSKAAENLEFFEYYKGSNIDIYNVNTASGYDQEALQASSSRRVNLYFYRFMIAPRLEIEAQKYKFNMNNTEGRHEAFADFISNTSDAVALASIAAENSVVLKDCVKGVVKSEIENRLIDTAHQIVVEESADNPFWGSTWGYALNEAVFREFELIWACKGFFNTKKPNGKVDCLNALISSGLNTFNDAFTAWKLAGETEALNTNIIIRSYLAQYYQHASNIKALYSKYAVADEDALIDAIGREKGIEASEFDLDLVKEKTDEYQLSILTTTNRILQEYQLPANQAASADISDIDAKIADGRSYLRPHPVHNDMYALSAILEFSNKSYLYTDIDVTFEVELEGTGATLLDPMSVELAPRRSESVPVDLVLPYEIQNRLLSEPFIFRMTVSYRDDTLTDVQIIDASSRIRELVYATAPPVLDIKAELYGENILLDAGGSNVHASQGTLSFTWAQVVKGTEPEVSILFLDDYAQTKEQVYVLTPDIQEKVDLWFKVTATASLSQAASDIIVKVTLYPDETPLNSNPVARAGSDITVQSGTPFTLNGSDSSDPDGDALAYTWYKGSTVVGTSSSLAQTQTTAGQYLYTLRVADPAGATDTDYVTVTVEAVPKGVIALSATTFSFGDIPLGQSGTGTLAISNTGNASLSNVTIQPAWGDTTAFGFSSMTIGTLAAGAGATVTITCTPASETSQAAVFNVTADGAAPKSMTLTASGVVNGLGARAELSPTTLMTGGSVSLTLDIYSGNSPYSMTVDWGDGSTGSIGESIYTENAFSHIYSMAGTYTVETRVTDAAGESAERSFTVTVADTVSMQTQWTAEARDIIDHEEVTGLPVTVTEKTSTYTYQEYTTSWTPSTSGNDFFVKHRLPVPPGVIYLDHKVRLTVVMESSGFSAYDRELAFVTDDYEFITSYVYNQAGYFRQRDLSTGEIVRADVNAFNDGVGFRTVCARALEIENGTLTSYVFEDDTYTPMLTHTGALGDRLDEIHVTFKGNGSVILAKLEYDMDGNGVYDDGYLVLNTPDRTVDWSQWEIETRPAADSLVECINAALGLPEDSVPTSAQLESITSLACTDMNISDLSALEGMTNLISLNLLGNQISDLTPLQGLTSLTLLALSDNQISDLTPIQGLTGLTGLILWSNQISDLTPLQELTNLTHLFLDGNPISDLTNFAPLQSLTSLTVLGLGSNEISDLTPFQGLTNLTELHLPNSLISDLSPLSGLTNLSELSLRVNQISDVTPLQSMTSLSSLDLLYNQISDLTPLQGLTNLTELNLEMNQISDLSALSGLANLTELFLNDNQISDLSPLSSLSHLINLNLSDNQISDLTPLQTLTLLEYLDVSFNCISDFSPVSFVPNLDSYVNDPVYCSGD